MKRASGNGFQRFSGNFSAPGVWPWGLLLPIPASSVLGLPSSGASMNWGDCKATMQKKRGFFTAQTQQFLLQLDLCKQSSLTTQRRVLLLPLHPHLLQLDLYGLSSPTPTRSVWINPTGKLSACVSVGQTQDPAGFDWAQLVFLCSLG